MTKVYFKGFLNALLFTLISMHSLAQLAPGQKWNEFMGDSLLGFDESELRSFAYGENLSVQATNSYLYNQKRFFIYQKYNFYNFKNAVLDGLYTFNGVSSNRYLGYQPPVINVAPCVNEGFETGNITGLSLIHI